MRVTPLFRVKDLVGMAYADAENNMMLKALVVQASELAQNFCMRRFEYAAKEAMFDSEEIYVNDTDPQIIVLDSPIDKTQPFTLSWSKDYHQTKSTVLTEGKDFILDSSTGVLRIRWTSESTSVGGTFIGGYGAFASGSTWIPAYPSGFKVVYSAGYKPVLKTELATKSPFGAAVDLVAGEDPLDEYGWLDAPEGLQQAVAVIVADAWKNSKRMVTSLSEEQKDSLRPFASPYRLG